MDFLEQLSIQDKNPGAFCGIDWQSSLGNHILESFNPATNEKIAEVSTCSEEDYHTIIGRLKAAAKEWRLYPAPKRGDIIRQIAQKLRENKELLGRLVSVEMGKSKAEGEGEVQEMIDIADFAVGQSRMLYGKTMHSERPFHRMYEQWHPYGIIGVISSFNFPVAVWSWNAFIAAICGNVVLWKPSSKTPLCAIATHILCSSVLQANNCPDIFGLIIPSTHMITEQMVLDTQIPLISFTGSTQTGKQVATQISSRLGQSILELGGNNAVILDESANLDLAIPGIVFGAVGTAGQRCTSTRRLFVHQSIYEDVLKRLRRAYQQIKVGDPLDSNNLMGPLIDQAAVEQFISAIETIKSQGGKILFGGEILSLKGHFVQPTLVTEMDNDSPIVQQETFAPILYVMPFNSLNEAVDLQNRVPQGLSSALFTQDLKHSEYFLSHLGSDCGIANINIGTSGAEIGGAFGGEKETGGGREAGSDSWKAYMRRQTNTINWGNTLPLAQGIQFEINSQELPD